MTDGQLSEAATAAFGEPLRVERAVVLVEGGEPGETAEILRFTAQTPPRARVMTSCSHDIFEDLPWEYLRDRVLKPLHESILELRASNN